jgi:hypothetical protein
MIDEKLTVMQVRPNYSIVYQFKPILKLERRHIKSQKHFVDYIKEVSTNWKDGDYFLKSTQGTFAYFSIAGTKIKLSKKSKTGKEYLCWQLFGPATASVNRVVATSTRKN